MDAEICADCAVESERGQTDEELEAAGWNLTGEFGATCPGCSKKRPSEDLENEGIGGLAEVVGAKQRE